MWIQCNLGIGHPVEKSWLRKGDKFKVDLEGTLDKTEGKNTLIFNYVNQDIVSLFGQKHSKQFFADMLRLWWADRGSTICSTILSWLLW